MTLTVLFDLDDTLLQTNTDRFFSIYYQEVGKAFSHILPPDRVARQFYDAFEKMEANQDPRRRLSEVFAESFFSPLGTSEEASQEVLSRFFQQEYPRLREITSQNPHAAELVSWCRAKEMTVVIATNPLFSDDNIRKRIEWAGLDPDQFALYTHMDDFHFTKPNLTFFAEVLGRLGWPEDGAVMIGDSEYFDISPARILGFPTFWVNDGPNGTNRSQGPLSGTKPWLEEQHRNRPISLAEGLEVDLAVLRATPAVIDSWLRLIPEDVLRRKPARDEWSVLEVLWHLADMENEVFNLQWRQLLSSPAKLVTSPDTSRWADQRRYQARDLSPALESFLEARLSSLALIEQLHENGLLDLSVQHTILSRAKVSELVSFVAKHDRLHLHQCHSLLYFC